MPPQEGDGFTFEHLAERGSIWLDFVADIGDGGDSTYAVASCMAAPTLLATDTGATSKAETNGRFFLLISCLSLKKVCMKARSSPHYRFFASFKKFCVPS